MIIPIIPLKWPKNQNRLLGKLGRSKNGPKYRTSYTGCPINMETRSTLIFSFCISATGKVKPVLKNLDPNLQGATLILIFFKKLDYFLGSAKKRKKTESFFWCHAITPFFSICPKFFFSQIHVPGYMNLKKKQNSMYRVHGFEEETKFHVPGYMNLKKQNLGTFWKKGGGGGMEPKKILFCFVFCWPKKIIWFLEKNQNQGGPLKVWI